MVRLKVSYDIKLNNNCDNFNSSMVRLKAWGIAYISWGMEFQFQYGTIKREKNLPISMKWKISIPVWYD